MGGKAGDGAGSGFSLARGMEPPPRLSSSRTIPCCRGRSGEGEQVQSRPKHNSGPRGAQVSPCPAGRVAGATGGVAPALPGPAGGSAPACPAKILVAVGPGGSWHPRPAGTWAAEPGSGCCSNGLIPAEAGSKAGADLDGVLLNNGEGARSLLLLAGKTCVFQSIGFWE